MKYEIAKMLKDAAPAFVSGGEIGRRFHVSRAAIWKHMEELRQEGYSIEASSRKGYRLLPSEERLSAWELSGGLGTSLIGSEINYFDTLDSTSRYAGRLASEGCRDGTTVVAGRQTEGRGRLGRSWESPAGMGIYLSVVLRPRLAPFEMPILTLAAAVAVAKAIKIVTGIIAGIKWPNDLILNGRKVCGILLEMNSEADRINHVIIGIGINYSQRQEDFPIELRDRAISLKTAVTMKEAVTMKGSAAIEGDALTGTGAGAGDAEFGRSAGRQEFDRLVVIQTVLRELDNVMKLVADGDTGKVLEAWRELSVTLGREVAFRMKETDYTGTAVDITEDGRLVVDCQDGLRRELLSGEISVRGLNGYV